MERDIRLPIKVVIPRDEDYRRPDHSGGGGNKLFGEVTPEVRDALEHQVDVVERFFQPSFRHSPGLPCVARVILKRRALAKSHRPMTLFDDTSCPVIGVGELGELYLRVQPDGLRTLGHKIRRLSTKVGVANISTIQQIAPFTAEDALGSRGRAGLREHICEGRTTLKLRLFRHHDSRMDDALLRALQDQVRRIGLTEPEPVYYAAGMSILKVQQVPEDAIDPLASFVGVQSLSCFPRYHVHRMASRALGPLQEELFPPPVANVEYPVVGIVDTGIDPNNPSFTPWVTAREEFVPMTERDYDHGTFVGGLAVNARQLNQHPRFPSTPAMLVDVQAMPRNGTMTEDELIALLEQVVPKYPDVRVWNLSLSRDEPCEDRTFSDLAAALDEMQDRHGVMFVIAAGNYNVPPFRSWPPPDLGEADRIAPPGDSVRALSVGSLAHLEKPSSCVRRDQPSPFSRRGPGPVFIPKPEIVHFGGNCDSAGNFIQTGIVSVNGNAQMAENIGTSFAAPMVSTLLANVDNALLEPASVNLTKALVVHSAVFGSPPIRAEELRYRGFGVPGDLVSVLTCSPWAATLIFEADLVPGIEFERWPFPIPDCLRGPGGVVRGEFLMTLVSNPPLDATFGAEYCRSNVDVSLGTYDETGEEKRAHRGQIPPEPKHISRLYEREQVEHGFKWSPVKVYRRHMPKGVAGDTWRLKVSVTHRSGFATTEAQDFALVVTLRDPEQSQPVYDEVVARMQQLGWTTLDLEVQERVRTMT